MPKKPSLQQQNNARLDQLAAQKISGKSGYIPSDLKYFIAENVINRYNGKKKSIPKNFSLQKEYNKLKGYYDNFFTKGLQGHEMFSGTLIKRAKQIDKAGGELTIIEKGKEKSVHYPEFAYKMERLAHKLSSEHDVAFTKFKPKFFLRSKGQYKISINIPDLDEIDLDESTVEEIMEFFDDNGVVVIISDPSNIKKKDRQEAWEDRKKTRMKTITRNKAKYYKEWKEGERK